MLIIFQNPSFVVFFTKKLVILRNFYTKIRLVKTNLFFKKFQNKNDGYKYVVPVATSKNLLSLVDNKESDFLFPMDPMIVVKGLTMENIDRAIKAYAEEDVFWLKFYHLAFGIDIKTLDILRVRWFERKKLINEILEKDQSIDIKNYDFIDFTINTINNG